EPLFSVLIGATVNIVGITLGTFLGKTSVAGPVIYAFLLDGGLMIEQIANRMSLSGIAPGRENRVNTAFMAMLILGQLAGTKAGNVMFAEHGGWYASGGLSIAIMGLSYPIVLARGPRATGWFGWKGGWLPKAETRDSVCIEQQDIEFKTNGMVEEIPIQPLGAAILGAGKVPGVSAQGEHKVG
ncbi:hypothetical protein LTR66_016442, partial [Elasticomyces elasticus]